LKAHVSFAAGEVAELFEKTEGGVVLRKPGEGTMRVASVHALDRWKCGSCLVEETEKLRRAAVDKLCAEFDGRVAVIRMEGEEAPTDAIAGFEDGDSEAGGGELGCGGKSGDSRADDEHVGPLRRRGMNSRSLHFAGLGYARWVPLR
jgi:hypothetical protein